jgi:Flp pilus assembly pilin Flp
MCAHRISEFAQAQQAMGRKEVVRDEEFGFRCSTRLIGRRRLHGHLWPYQSRRTFVGSQRDQAQTERGRFKVFQMFHVVANQALSFLREEVAQDAFEYALVVGGISVAIVAAMILLAGAAPGLVTSVCQSMNTVLPVDIPCV